MNHFLEDKSSQSLCFKGQESDQSNDLFFSPNFYKFWLS